MNEKSVYVQRGGTRFLFLGDNANWNFGAVLGEDTGYFWKVSFYLHFYFSCVIAPLYVIDNKYVLTHVFIQSTY